MSDDREPEPAFDAPWEARTFAMVRQLRDRGVFTHEEWSHALGAELGRAGGDGASTYLHWLTALERLIAAKGAASARALERHRSAWEQAALRTPHGQPIELAASDFQQ